MYADYRMAWVLSKEKRLTKLTDYYKLGQVGATSPLFLRCNASMFYGILRVCSNIRFARMNSGHLSC